MNEFILWGYILLFLGMISTIIFQGNFLNLKKSKRITFTILGVIMQVSGIFLSSYLGPHKISNEKEELFSKEMEIFYNRLSVILNNSEKYDSSKYHMKGEILILDKEFNTWAENFLRNKDSINLSIQMNKISNEQQNQLLDKEWFPVYNNLLQNIENLLKAYNLRVNYPIRYNIITLPRKLSTVANDTTIIGKIWFKENRIWNITFNDFPKNKVRPKIPNINIYITSSEYEWLLGESPEISILINPQNKKATLYLQQMEIVIPNIETSYNLDIKPDVLNEIFEKLIEYELAQL